MTVIIHSRKLFYKEWAYKVRLKMPTGYNQYIRKLLTYVKDSTVENKMKSLMKSIRYEGRQHGPYAFEFTDAQLNAMYDFIFYCRKENLRKNARINEYWRIITVYCNDKRYVEDICDKFEAIVESAEMPASDEELQIMQEKKNTTIVDRLPYNKYRYACSLDYWSSRDNICPSFVKWSKPYGKRIKISSRWGYGGGNYAFSKFWVEDEKLLNMIKLFLGTHITKVETYKLRAELEN